jgi:hypothetical protein
MRDHSICMACGQQVSGKAGDPKVFVGHEQAVICMDCFDHHPRREEWLGYRPGEHRPGPRRMLVG